MNKGTIVQIIGPVVDAQFSEKDLPAIYNALETTIGKNKLTLEVQQHLGEGLVRAVAMSSTDGLKRGTAVSDTGAPISVPVGDEVLGRLFNVLGETIDNKGAVKTLPAGRQVKRMPIHRSAPSFDEQSVTSEVFETGIKVIDLLAPF